MISKLNILEMGDIHLGHRRTSTHHIIENLNKVLNDTAMMTQTDLFIIAGDLFDRLLPLSNPDVSLCHRWIHRLFAVCHRYDITLRVLEGTPSHDNRQPSMMLDVLSATGIEVDFKYVDTLSIEYIEKFDTRILYIPDEWNPSCDKTLEEVKDLMTDQGLTQVDFAVMHGQFDCQLPEHLLKIIPHHNSKAYLDLVKYLIYIGHVHTSSVHDRIIAAGSFDRLSHGEEEDKGYTFTTVFESGQFDLTFKVNEHAKKYVTYNYQGSELGDTLADLKRRLQDLPDDSYVRVKLHSKDPLAQSTSQLVKEYPQFHLTFVTEKAVKVDKQSVPTVKPVMSALRIDKLPELLHERIKYKLEEHQLKDINEKMKELVRNFEDVRT